MLHNWANIKNSIIVHHSQFAFHTPLQAHFHTAARQFCRENFLSPQTLELISEMRYQFADLLRDIGFLKPQKGMQMHCKSCWEALLIYLIPGAYQRSDVDRMIRDYSYNSDDCILKVGMAKLWYSVNISHVLRARLSCVLVCIQMFYGSLRKSDQNFGSKVIAKQLRCTHRLLIAMRWCLTGVGTFVDPATRTPSNLPHNLMSSVVGWSFMRKSKQQKCSSETERWSLLFLFLYSEGTWHS